MCDERGIEVGFRTFDTGKDQHKKAYRILVEDVKSLDEAIKLNDMFDKKDSPNVDINSQRSGFEVIFTTTDRDLVVEKYNRAKELIE